MQFLPLILTIGLFVASLWRPFIALVAVILMFPLGMALQATLPVFATHTWLFNILIASMAAIALVRMGLSRDHPLLANLFTPTLIAAWGLYIWSCITLAWSPDPEAPLREFYNGLPYWLLLLVAAPMLIRRVEEFDRLVPALLLVGTLIALAIILNPNFNFYAGRFGLQLGVRERTNPLQLGTLGGLLVVIAVLTLLQKRGIWHWGIRLAALIAGAGIAILSGSRGNLVFAIGTCLLFAPLAYRISSARGVLLTVLASLALVGGLYLAARRFITADNLARWDPVALMGSGEGRFENVGDLLGAYIEQPGTWLQGLGLSAFRVMNTRSGDPYSHVMLADAIAETGLIGLMLLGLVALLAWRSARRLLAMLEPWPITRINMVAVLASAFYYFTLANKQGSYLGSTLLFTMLIIMARAESELRQRIALEHDLSWQDADGEPEAILVDTAGGTYR